MGSYVTSLGGGISDTGTSYFSSFVATTDVTSAWNPSNTAVSGAFDSTGTTASSARPARVNRLRLRLGGTYTTKVGNAKTELQLATSKDGSGGYNLGSTHTQTGTTSTSSTGVVSWAIDANDTYYYGARGVSGTGSTFVFARGGTGDIYLNGTAQSAFAGDSLSGDIQVQSIPSAPGAPSASSIGTTSLTLTWTAPADDGMQDPAAYTASKISGYRINYKANSASAWSVLVANTGSNALSATVTGLGRNTAYDFQVAALNEVTDAHNTNYSSITAHVGVRSSTGVATTLAGGPKVWNGTTWSTSELKVWNGTTWTTGATTKVWNGTGWSNIT